MKRALLVIDVQNEYFTGKLPITYPEGSLDNILKAMDAANEKGIPVIIVQHTAPQRTQKPSAKGAMHGAFILKLRSVPMTSSLKRTCREALQARTWNRGCGSRA